MIEALLSGLIGGAGLDFSSRGHRRLGSLVGKALGFEMLVVALVGGTLSAVLVLSDDGGAAIAEGMRWLILPAAVPVAWCIARGRGLRRGLVASAVSALWAFLVVGLYLCFRLFEYFFTWGGSF